MRVCVKLLTYILDRIFFVLLCQTTESKKNHNNNKRATTTTSAKKKTKPHQKNNDSSSVRRSNNNKQKCVTTTTTQQFPVVGFGKCISSIDMKIFSLVNEVSKSKDETIAAKNHTIQILETLLKLQQHTSSS